MPGTPLLVLEDTSLFKVDAYVNERLLGKVRIGMPVTVVPAGEGARCGDHRGDRPRRGPRDEELSRQGLSQGAVLEVGPLREDSDTRRERSRSCSFPRRAVVEKGQLTGVYVVDNQGVMTYRIIRTGRAYGDEVEVVSGLKPGERIVVAGLEHAVDGGVVKTMSARGSRAG